MSSLADEEAAIVGHHLVPIPRIHEIIQAGSLQEKPLGLAMFVQRNLRQPAGFGVARNRQKTAERAISKSKERWKGALKLHDRENV
jgi:hypothetical protein